MRKPLQRAYLVSSAPFREYLQQRLDVVELGQGTIQGNQDALRREVADLNRLTEETQDYIRALAAQLGAEMQQLADRLTIPEAALLAAEREAEQMGLAGLSAPLADLINFSRSHRGFSAEAGLWMNDAVVIGHSPQSVAITGINSRIVEVPYCFHALKGLPAGSRIVDVGASESTLAVSLASLGYEVVAVDPRGYPFTHPQLRVHHGTLDDLNAAADLDAVVFLSSVEHFGLPAYSLDGLVDPDADRRALQGAMSLLRPGGLVVLTVPFGRATVSDFERIYDRAALEALLDDFGHVQVEVASRADDLTWVMSTPQEAEASGGEAVALVTATAPG